MSNDPISDIHFGDAYDREPGGPRRLGLKGPSYDPRSRRRLILVHGFNAGPDTTSQSYDKFRAELRKVAPRLDRDVWTLSWPGRKLYWNAVALAEGVIAALLADHLAETAADQIDELVFVAHSLGCRLVLEALAQLPPAAATLLPRTRLFLLAAAVPTRSVAPGQPLRSIIERSRRSEIFYSWRDEALGPAFTVFQFKDQGAWTRAVGLLGEPAELWGRRRHHMVGYSHGAYWPSDRVAYRVALSMRAVETRPTWRLSRRASRRIASRGLLGREPPVRMLPSRRAP